MSDEQKQLAVDTPVDESVSAGEDASVASPAEGEGVEAPEPKATPESAEEVKATEEAATSKEAETKAEDKGGKKPTRAERRVHQLLEKIKEMKATLQEQGGTESRSQADAVSEILGVEGQLPWAQGESPFKPGEEVSLDQLEAELNRRAATLAELKAKQVVEQYRQQERLQKTLDEYAGELEKLAREVPELNPDAPEYDPKLDSQFAELVRAVNSDEKGRFVPKKRPSEIFEALKAAMDKARTKGQAETTAKMAKNIAEAAVSPTASAKKRFSTAEEIEEALRKGEITAEEAEKLLPKVGFGY